MGSLLRNKVLNILVLAPHPDDEVLGCGGTMIKFIKGGHKVKVAYITSGDSQQKIREKEAKSVCNLLGVDEVFFLRLDKKNILVFSVYNTSCLLNLFKKTLPDLIFINHDKDGDRDHKVAYQLVSEAFWRHNFIKSNKQIKGFFLYEIHNPMTSYSLVEDISGVINKKMEAMLLYKSQIKKSRVDLAIVGLNRYRGSMHENVDYAEVFQIKKLTSLFS